MIEQLEGRVAVITGAGGGLGREFSRLAARARMRLVLADVQHDVLQATVQELQGSGATCPLWATSTTSARCTC